MASFCNFNKYQNFITTQYDRVLSYLFAVHVLVQYDDEYLTLFEPDKLSKYNGDWGSTVESWSWTCFGSGLENLLLVDPNYLRCNATVYALENCRPIIIKMFKKATSSKCIEVNEAIFRNCKQGLSISTVKINLIYSFFFIFPNEFR